MKATKILSEDILDLTVASLPTRPTADSSVGGGGYSAKMMKEAFDRLPLYIISCFNDLIDDIRAVGEGSLSAEIQTGISASHSLNDLFKDISSGDASSYLTVLGKPLSLQIAEILERLGTLEEERVR